jgi:hypothetical protein
VAVDLVGHEVIYRYINHILGQPKQFSGVGMHIGHFASQFRIDTTSTITNSQMRRLLHTGITLWLRGFGELVLRPCCDLKFIGGDGTVIGITTPNIPKSTLPVWHPKTLRHPLIDWNRRSRQALSSGFASAGLNDQEAAQFLEHLQGIVTPRQTEAARRSLSMMLTEAKVLQKMSPELCVEFHRWLLMPTLSLEFEPLERVFSCLFSQGSLTGLFPPQLASIIIRNKVPLMDQQHCNSTIERLSLDYAFKGCGIGVEVMQILRAQVMTKGLMIPSTVNFFLHFAELALRMHNMPPEYSQSQSTESDSWCDRPNPAMTGIRYFATEHGRSVNSSWPLSEVSISKFTQTETSCDGCTKKRLAYFAHSQRTSIWINLCMIHEHVVGFHLIHSQEGRRDALVPIYRFWESPPLAIWNDFGCGCEESGLNWLPEYFHNVQHFHDMFHGFSHTSCSEKFSSRRLPTFSAINTSLMEQFNSFLQPVRALVKSRTTKVIYTEKFICCSRCYG